MAKFTFLEVHLDGAEFTNLTGAGEEATEVVASEESEDEAEESGGGGLVGAVVALVVLGVLAYAATRYLGGEESDLDDDLPDIEE